MTHNKASDGLAAFARGEPFDWSGAIIEASTLSRVIREAAASGSSVPLSLVNAQIKGDLALDAIGDVGCPLRLQILGCKMSGGFRARQSHWKTLVIGRTKVAFVDLPRSRFDGDLVLENLTCDSWLELRGSNVEGQVSLRGSRFKDGSREAAVDVSKTKVGLDFDAREIILTGEFHGRRLGVDGDLLLDGAQIDDSHSDLSIAVGLQGGRIAGQLRMCQFNSKRFEAKGLVHLGQAEIGTLVFKSAKLHGDGKNALVAEELHVRHTLDLSGLSAENGPKFEASGALRLGSCRIGGQIQIVDALVEGDEPAINLHGSKIVGDVLIGHPTAETEVRGGIRADVLQVGGRFVVIRSQFAAKESALSIRQSNIAQELAVYDVVSDAPIRFDNTSAASITFENLKIIRDLELERLSAAPEQYADAADALLDVSFSTVASDLRVQNVELGGGDFRLIGAEVHAGVQISMLNISPSAKPALIGQSLRVGGGLQIAGSIANPCRFAGNVHLLGAKIGDDLTLVDLEIGSPTDQSDLTLTSISAGSITILRSVINGGVNAVAANIDRDFHLHSSRFLNDGGTAIDARRISVGSKLQLATARDDEPVNCEVRGLVSTDSALAAVFGWHRVELAEQSCLQCTNMTVTRQVELVDLKATAPSRIDFMGTKTPLLIDSVCKSEDSWGGGSAQLGLNNFEYLRLANPSGDSNDAAKHVRQNRQFWLARRYDKSSARPLRQLASTLRGQGSFEASRLLLMDAFDAEARAKTTIVEQVFAHLFGFFFGYGLSGRRAALSLISLWLLGALGLGYLQERHVLITGTSTTSNPSAPCPAGVDPLLLSADLMIPIADLGQDKSCSVGPTKESRLFSGRSIRDGRWTVLSELDVYRFAFVMFQIVGWIFLSLAIATWSGLFRRGGRD